MSASKGQDMKIRTITDGIYLRFSKVVESPVGLINSNSESLAMLFVVLCCKLRDGFDFFKVPDGVPESSID